MPKSYSLGLFLLRVTFGLVIAAHGAYHLAHFQQLVGFAGSRWQAAGAIAGELGGGIGLAVGLLTRLAGVGYGVVMLAIAFTHNVTGGVAHTILSIGHGGAAVGFEYPFLVGVLGIAFLFTGPGDWSLDGLLFSKQNRRSR